MRLDKYLIVARLLKQRTRAKELCDGGHVKVAGKSAKAAYDVKPGDVLEITLPRRRLVARVVTVPATKSVPKDAAAGLYEILEDQRTKDDGDAGRE